MTSTYNHHSKSIKSRPSTIFIELFLPVGIGIGAAIGVALESIGLGVALGGGISLAVATFWGCIKE